MAREDGGLLPSQQHIAYRAEILMHGLTHVGIVALVDEATEYQEDRNRNILQEILDKYLFPYRTRWGKRFPDEFDKEIFRLKCASDKAEANRPQVVEHYTNDIVSSVWHLSF